MSAPEPRNPSTPEPAADETLRLPAGEPVDPRSTVQMDIPKLLSTHATLKLPRRELANDPDQTQRLTLQHGEEPPIRVQKVDHPLETEGQTQQQAHQPTTAKSFGWKRPLGLVAVLVIVGVVLYLFSPGAGSSAGALSAKVGTTAEAAPPATEVYLQQAKAGDAHAMRLLGVMYYYGLNVPQDREKGLYWYRKAAEKGSDAARLELAKIEGGR
jgi:Sel1 repeat